MIAGSKNALSERLSFFVYIIKKPKATFLKTVNVSKFILIKTCTCKKPQNKTLNLSRTGRILQNCVCFKRERRNKFHLYHHHQQDLYLQWKNLLVWENFSKAMRAKSMTVGWASELWRQDRQTENGQFVLSVGLFISVKLCPWAAITWSKYNKNTDGKKQLFITLKSYSEVLLCLVFCYNHPFASCQIKIKLQSCQLHKDIIYYQEYYESVFQDLPCESSWTMTECQP